MDDRGLHDARRGHEIELLVHGVELHRGRELVSVPLCVEGVLGWVRVSGVGDAWASEASGAGVARERSGALCDAEVGLGEGEKRRVVSN